MKRRACRIGVVTLALLGTSALAQQTVTLLF